MVREVESSDRSDLLDVLETLCHRRHGPLSVPGGEISESPTKLVTGGHRSGGQARLCTCSLRRTPGAPSRQESTVGCDGSQWSFCCLGCFTEELVSRKMPSGSWEQ